VHELKKTNDKSKTVTMYPFWTQLCRGDGFGTESIQTDGRKEKQHAAQNLLRIVNSGIRQKWNEINVKTFARGLTSTAANDRITMWQQSLYETINRTLVALALHPNKDDKATASSLVMARQLVYRNEVNIALSGSYMYEGFCDWVEWPNHPLDNIRDSCTKCSTQFV